MGLLRYLGCRFQRTLRQATMVTGRGYRTGQEVRVCFRPAPPDTGIVFVRDDLPAGDAIPARVDQVSCTQRRTTLGHLVRVEMVEHVLAALWGLKIDNCYILTDGPELPGMDGSAQHFVEALHRAGVSVQDSMKGIWTVQQPLSVQDDRGSLTLYPASDNQLHVSYLLDYGLAAPIPPQRHSETLTPQSFSANLAGCRTFLLEAEAEALRRQGIGQHISPADLLVFGRNGPVANRLRYADEPCRHKILDIVGDIALLGQDLAGHLIGCRSGHSHNVALVRNIVEAMTMHQPVLAAA